ncbi:MAG: transcriptional repressor [Desulfobacteraceae bacterium]|nr:transcriptional repressor [Desulfobacteraceae bacterium]
MRHTKQRKLILECLRMTTSHPTAVEVYDQVRNKMPNISLGTVYRNLDYLCSHGLARKIDTCGERKRFDATVEDHVHIICTVCGKVRDAETGPGISPQTLMHPENTAASGFKITGVRIDILGICPECQKRQPSKTNP